MRRTLALPHRTAPPRCHAATPPRPTAPPRRRAAAPPRRRHSYRSYCSCNRRRRRRDTDARLRRPRPCRYDEDGSGSLNISEFKQHFKKRNDESARAHYPATARSRARPRRALSTPPHPLPANLRHTNALRWRRAMSAGPTRPREPGPDPAFPSLTRLRW